MHTRPCLKGPVWQLGKILRLHFSYSRQVIGVDHGKEMFSVSLKLSECGTSDTDAMFMKTFWAEEKQLSAHAFGKVSVDRNYFYERYWLLYEDKWLVVDCEGCVKGVILLLPPIPIPPTTTTTSN